MSSYIAFTDLTKASFDLVSRHGLFKILAKIGCPPKLQSMIGIFFGLLLKHAFDTTTEGIYLRTRADGRFFNVARLRAKTKVRKVLIRDMLFADDAAVSTHTQE